MSEGDPGRPGKRPRLDPDRRGRMSLTRARRELFKVHDVELARALRALAVWCLDATEVARLLPERTRAKRQELVRRIEWALELRRRDRAPIAWLRRQRYLPEGPRQLAQLAVRLGVQARELHPGGDADLVVAFGHLALGWRAHAARGFRKEIARARGGRLEAAARAGLAAATGR